MLLYHRQRYGCFRLQRYKFLKAIHNSCCKFSYFCLLFQTTKIQIFESNSQPLSIYKFLFASCFRLQRYKFLKAIHNFYQHIASSKELFQTTKIQIFESNSQRKSGNSVLKVRCFRLQRYKFLKAIHNLLTCVCRNFHVVSDYKDTNFSKQFITYSKPLSVNLKALSLYKNL